jgi:hypothetical protein
MDESQLYYSRHPEQRQIRQGLVPLSAATCRQAALLLIS